METISSKQTELDTFIADGYKTALSEERRRYCFLVDRQCAVAKNSSAYHGKVRSLNYHTVLGGDYGLFPDTDFLPQSYFNW